MGQVFVDIQVVNLVDLAIAKRGLIKASDVRSVELRGVLADTGANTLCLPRRVVERLGLHLARTVAVGTAAGPVERRLFQGALVRYEDREAESEVLEMGDDVDPLLGALPMEAMGIELDLQRRAIRKLSVEGRTTFWHA